MAGLPAILQATHKKLSKLNQVLDATLSTLPTLAAERKNPAMKNARADKAATASLNNQVLPLNVTHPQAAISRSTSSSTIVLQSTDALRSPHLNSQPNSGGTQGPKIIYPPFNEANVSRRTRARELLGYQIIRDDMRWSNPQVRYQLLLKHWAFNPTPNDRDTWVPVKLVEMCSIVGKMESTTCRVCGQQLFFDKVARAHEDAAHGVQEDPQWR